MSAAVKTSRFDEIRRDRHADGNVGSKRRSARARREYLVRAHAACRRSVARDEGFERSFGHRSIRVARRLRQIDVVIVIQFDRGSVVAVVAFRDGHGQRSRHRSGNKYRLSFRIQISSKRDLSRRICTHIFGMHGYRVNRSYRRRTVEHVRFEYRVYARSALGSVVIFVYP